MATPVNQQDPRESARPDGVKEIIDTPILSERMVEAPQLIDTPILSSRWTKVKRACHKIIDTPILVARWIWGEVRRLRWS